MKITLEEIQSAVQDVTELKTIEIDPEKKYLFLTKGLSRPMLDHLGEYLRKQIGDVVVVIGSTELYDHMKVYEIERS